jgi:WD40 repeat protein
VRAFSERGARWKIGLAALALAGLAGWIAVGLHTERSTRPFAWTARRLSVPANVTENDCSISPDGTKIAYLADSSAALMIFSIDSSDTRTVDRLPPGEGNYFNVGWSSDGSKLVASRCDALGNATVVLVDLITGHREVLARLGALGPEQVHDLHASLSPHGDLLAVRRGYRPATGAFLELGVLDIRTGTERIVARGGENEFINPPIWAPTGARLAYVLTRGFEEYSRVETCDLRGKRTTVVEDSSNGLQPYGYAYPSLQWLDDHRLLYALRPGHHGDLGDAEWWSIQVDPATGQTSGEARQEYALPGAGVHSPSASRDGHVAFAAQRVFRQLGLIGTDGRARYPELTSGAQLGNLQFPVWSNDARRLFVRSDKNPARIAIGWLGLDDGRFEPLPTEINTLDRPLCLTSDDREVLCARGSKLAAIRVADGVERVVADPFPGIVLRASRSDAWVAVEHLGSDIVVRDFNPGAGLGAVRFRYPANGLEEGFPPTADLSPDGKWLVVLRPDAPGYDVLDAARGRLLRRIDLPSKSYPQSVRWSPDGTSLYATGLDGPANFWIARLGERGIDRLIWKSEHVWPGYLDVSRDGTTLGFTSLELNTELWLLQPR